ncbi:lysozyme inhibitor LprI family protein [Rhizobium oryziradicis]|uniref:Urease-associated protein n=1 Tax=Rhizobium oryziradicis TaxID=1867956 RepID=A0A1Q8ZQR2_9HYPH|nr:lysozyme inhibitor LprI family protein [Rhizobium oryziradicis]OLP44241.1 urease-associated protein [Rhizobium oryziradicis]
MRLALAILACLVVSAGSAYAVGPKLNCQDPQTQAEMTQCAGDEFDAADKALNAQWKLTRAALVETDANLDADQKGAEKALLKGQRAWIDYRDGQCEAEGFSVRGGTMEPMMVASCKARLTELRTKELKSLAEPQ